MRYLTQLAVLTLILSSCAKQSFRGNSPPVELLPHVESFFEAYAGARPQIQYALIPLEDKSAECIWNDEGKRIINVNSNVWDDFCPNEQKAVIWHELGHCVLGRGHTAQADLSYMRSAITGNACQFYIDNEQELDDEMFNYTGDAFIFKGLCVHE
jgi:hypothetical protein